MVRFFFTCFLRTLRGNVKAQKRECTQRAIERTAADAQAKVLCFGQLDSNMGVLWRCPITVQAHNACVRVVRPSRETLCMWRMISHSMQICQPSELKIGTSDLAQTPVVASLHLDVTSYLQCSISWLHTVRYLQFLWLLWDIPPEFKMSPLCDAVNNPTMRNKPR